MGERQGVTPLQFHVENDWNRYEKKIWKVRLRASNDRRVLSLGGKRYTRVVLPEQRQNVPLTSFELVLQTSTTAVTVKIAKENLYILGYMDNGGNWHQFNSREIDIPNATKLPYDGGYPQLENYAGNRSMIQLGCQALVNAVNVLAEGSSSSSRGEEAERVRAKSLIILVEMISETSRFNNILEYVANLDPCGNSSTYIPEPWMISLENEWSSICKELVKVHNDPSHIFRPLCLQVTPKREIEDARVGVSQVAVL